MSEELLKQVDEMLKNAAELHNETEMDAGAVVVFGLIKALADELRGAEWQPISKVPMTGERIELWHVIHKSIITMRHLKEPIEVDDSTYQWVTACNTHCWPIHAFSGWRYPSQPPKDKDNG